MKLCRFARPNGTVGWGVITPKGVHDVSREDATLPSKMVDIINGWPQLCSRIQGLEKRVDPSQESLRFLCPLDHPRKVMCIGLNYRDHAIETGQAIPNEPMVFCKVPTAVIGPDENIVLPRVSQQVDYEAELVVVMGSRVKNVDLDGAHRAIFGYTVGHDVSARDWQTGKPGKQYFLGKSFDTFAPLGPAITLANEVPNPQELKIESRINGELMQSSSTSQLIFSPATLVSYISQVITLDAGDVIFTGTPPGVGVARKPQRFLQPGDIVEIEIEGLGMLRNTCVAEE